VPRSKLAERARVVAHIDLAPAERPPATGRLLIAAVISIGASLGADAALVAIGTHLFPSTNGFSHFRFFDYATLTVIGIALAAPVWPIVARISSSPRWLLLRLAVIATFVLWLPDLYLVFVKHETTSGVATLMVMHLVVALITYNVFIHVAPTRRMTDAAVSDSLEHGEMALSLEHRDDGSDTAVEQHTPAVAKALWSAMLIGVFLEFTFGLVALLFVPTSRPSVWIPAHGRVIYLMHGLFGTAILFGSVVAFVVAKTFGRRAVLGTTVGLVGIVLGAAGGLFAVDHGVRLLGMALMFVGSAVAFFGYLVPLVESTAVESELAPDEPS